MEGQTVHFELWGGPKEIDPFKDLSTTVDYEDDDGTEIYAIWACGFTNAEWMVGLSAADPDADWSTEDRFNIDEWGDALQAIYGFISKQGSLTGSYAYQGSNKIASSIALDEYVCDGPAKSCTIKFSRELGARPGWKRGETIYFVSA